jgi:5-(carboxyamino)imidazole ribonucleotide synthase
VKPARPILPGACIGILGGGQLGRMGPLAARAMGYRVIVLDPDANCSAASVVDDVIVGDFDDPEAAAKLRERADVIGYEIEKIGSRTLAALDGGPPLRPGPHVLHMVQDRARQKAWLSENKFPVGPFAHVTDAASLLDAVTQVGTPSRLKTCQGGYDGRGQVVVRHMADAQGAWESLGKLPCVLERELTLDAELSVMVARRPSGEMRVFAPARNWHERGVLKISVIPADLPDPLLHQARQIAEDMARALELEGVLAVELFATSSHGLCINELASRPHNTFHPTQLGCATSQFEQWVRALCDLPLGSTQVHRPTALANLLGDMWATATPDFAAAWAHEEVQVHLYGKSPRPGRKMGHLLAGGVSANEALRRVHAAYAACAGSG